MAEREAVVRPLGRPGDLGWVVMAHGESYEREFGWDAGFEALVARIVADYADGPGHFGRGAGSAGSAGTGDGRAHRPQAAWIAEVAGVRAGCVFCVAEDDRTAKLRLLLVDPSARGLGLGARLVGQCLDFAREAGYEAVTLWTNDVLTAARRIYRKQGFELVAEEPHRSFGHDLVGQTWRRAL